MLKWLAGVSIAALALAQPSHAQVSSTVIVPGSTPVIGGACPTGQNLYNNNSIVGCQANGGGGGSGTVTSVATACGVSGGPITTTGTISGNVAANAQTGSSYTQLSTDCGKLVTLTNAGAIAFTLSSTNFSAGNYFNAIVLPGSTGSATFTPSSGTVNGAASLVMAPGSPGGTFVFDGVNWTFGGSGVVPVAGPASSTDGNIASFNGAGGKTIKDSGLSTVQLTPPLPATVNDTQFYPVWPGISPVTGVVAQSQNSAHCTPFFVAQPMHWDQLAINLTTTGTGPITVALYTDAIDSTSHKHQPQTLESSNSLSFTVTGAPAVQTVALGVAGTGIAIPPGLNWVCTNDVTSTDAARFTVVPATQSLLSSYIGTTTAANAITNAQTNYLSNSQTSGTWPSFVGLTFAEQNAQISINFAYRVASAP